MLSAQISDKHFTYCSLQQLSHISEPSLCRIFLNCAYTLGMPGLLQPADSGKPPVQIVRAAAGVQTVRGLQSPRRSGSRLACAGLHCAALYDVCLSPRPPRRGGAGDPSAVGRERGRNRRHSSVQAEVATAAPRTRCRGAGRGWSRVRVVRGPGEARIRARRPARDTAR